METGIPARLTAREGRRFAFPVGIAFLALGGLTWWRNHVAVAAIFGTIAILLLAAGLVIPGLLGPIYRAWMGFAHLLSKVTNPIFMGVVYFLVITPIGLLMRLLGHNPIVRQPRDGGFWIGRPETRGRRSDLRRQF